MEAQAHVKARAHTQAQGTPHQVGYWILTGLIVLSQGASGIGDLAGAAPLVEAITALGYPVYLLKILGTAKLLGVIALAAPGFPRLKEWAYAGFVFDFLGAFASHLLNGDGPGLLAPPLVVLAILIGSYLLRPADRRVANPAAPGGPPAEPSGGDAT